MKQKIEETIQIPEGVSCTLESGVLKCKKDSAELSRPMVIPQVDVKLDGNSISLVCEKGNKNQIKLIRSYLAHIKNIFSGLNEKFVYELEAVNVHFPMTLKLEGDKISITNFLGEKKPRFAKVFPGAEVDIKGQKITVSSHNREAAGQTAANLEKATKVKGRDRRIYQDGIFITSKPERRNG